MKKSLGLFEGFGVEMEYMIVDKDSLNVRPIADEILKQVIGEYESDYENGDIAWSNELVLHVIELKTNGPAKSLNNLSGLFEQNVNKINEILSKYNSMLLSSAAHPFFNPNKETRLWPHENNPVYEAYNRIFDCSGHGWSNLQSTHINLPFKNDDEFGRLHAAIRLLLPIIPAIAASSPMLDKAYTGFADSRLEVYRKNQVKIPSITGKVIPEAVFSKKEYEDKIFKRIWKDISAFDPDGILQYEWLNSRGAIARFERNAIEIRVIDIQECPKADIALAGLFVSVLMDMVNERYISYEKQQSYSENDLAQIFLGSIKHGESTIIDSDNYLTVFGINKQKIQAKELWQNIYRNLEFDNKVISEDELRPVETIINEGTLSNRIKRSLGTTFTKDSLIDTYRKLSESLQNNKMFIP